jgi:hypothetical protein
MTLPSSFYMNCLEGLLKPQFVTQSPSLLPFAEKDYAYCVRRFSAEGAAFLTVALPSLRKAIDLSFQTGTLEPPKSFGLMTNKGYPAFLSSHFSRIYNDDGSLLAKPSVTRIKHVRQVCDAFYKLELPYSKATIASTLDSFISNEERVSNWVDSVVDDPPYTWASQLITGAAWLTRYVFRGFDPMDIVPRHGPGKLATGEIGEGKWNFTSYPRQMQRVYAAWSYLYGNPKMFEDNLDAFRNLDRPERGRSKVKLVPKDSRGPRIITMEPNSNQFLQQGLGRSIMRWLETRSLTKGRINFIDQEVNQYLALSSSISGEWATLDLKDASDLLSAHLVERVFRMKPKIAACLLAVRTPETLLPNGTVTELKKYAGMGSACCFPIEAYVFFAICVSAIAQELGIGLREACEFVYIYGDDIIVPTDLSDLVMAALHCVGLTVNVQKSYTKGLFRESCGVDAFAGFNVTTQKVHKLFPAGL